MRKLLDMRKLMHAMLFIALVSIFAGSSLSAIAQQPGAGAPSAVGTEGQLKPTTLSVPGR